jgi:DNA-binding beta-propeller fold protein YncE
MEALRPGDPASVGPYRLVGRLGAGGMGEVFLAETPGGRKVAVKLINRGQAPNARFRERFAREVEAARRVGGFHTAQLVDADPQADPPWMVTAYIGGPSLEDAVGAGGPLPPDRVRALGAGLAEGLAAIHACGLVHRDLKPGNVILAADGPRIIDFGIARVLDASAPITLTGAVIGTMAYMSPEQIRGEVAGPASDVFSLGSVLTFAATGQPPFGSDSALSVMFRVVNEPPDLAAVGDGALREVVAACLAKAPAGRPAVRAVMAALSRPGPAPAPAVTGPERAAVPPHGTVPPAGAPPSRVERSRAERARRSRRRAAGLIAAAAVGAVVVAVVLVVSLVPGSTPQAGAGHRPSGAASAGSTATTRDRPGTGETSAGRTTLVRDLTLHHDPADVGENDISFSANGALLADTGPDGLAYVWDVATGTLARALTTPSGSVAIPAFSPDGTLLASSAGGAAFHDVDLWDVATGQRVTTLINPPEPIGVDALAFSPDGKFLAVGDGAHVCIWDLATRTLTVNLTTSGTLVDTMAFSPDDALLATSTITGGDGANPVQLWDVTTGELVATPLAGLVAVEKYDVHSLVFSPDGKLLTASGGGGIYFWSVATRSITATIPPPGGGTLPLVYSPDGALLAAADWGSSDRAYIWDAATRTRVYTFTDPGGYPVSDVAFSPDGKLLAFADRVGEVYVKVTSQLAPGD